MPKLEIHTYWLARCLSSAACRAHTSRELCHKSNPILLQHPLPHKTLESQNFWSAQPNVMISFRRRFRLLGRIEWFGRCRPIIASLTACEDVAIKRAAMVKAKKTRRSGLFSHSFFVRISRTLQQVIL